jgi:hypothetical protein
MKLAKTVVLAALAATGASAQTKSRHAEAPGQLAVRHDQGGDLEPAVAAGVPP